MKGEQKLRRAKALAAATRRRIFGLAAGIGFGLVIFVIILRMTPTIAPYQMADLVKQLAVQETAADKAPAWRETRATAPGIPSDGSGRSGKPAARLSQGGREYVPISFETLSSFPFVVTREMVTRTNGDPSTAPRIAHQIPSDVVALNEKPVALQGFMLPIKYKDGLTREFLLLKSQSLCCYGVTPKITEWVNVSAPGKGWKPILDEPVTICGVFHAGEVRENGDLVGIYRLDGDQLIKP